MSSSAHDGPGGPPAADKAKVPSPAPGHGPSSAIVSGGLDRTALKVNQAAIVSLVTIAFVADAPGLVALAALSLALGTAWPAAGPFRLVYSRLLRPVGLLRPALVEEDPAPHRFAMGLGASCLGVALLLFLAGAAIAGWLVAWLVVILAAVNLLAGFCLGCFVHFQLARRGLLRVARREGAT